MANQVLEEITKYIKLYKEQGMLKSRGRPSPQRALHIEGEVVLFIF